MIFVLGGFTTFSGIAGGSTYAPMSVEFDPIELGTFDETVTLDPVSENLAGLGTTNRRPITLTIEGTVVPEPGSLSVLLGGVRPATPASLTLLGLRRGAPGLRGSELTAEAFHLGS